MVLTWKLWNKNEHKLLKRVIIYLWRSVLTLELSPFTYVWLWIFLVQVIDIPKIGCICNRSVKTVLCRSCGQMFGGRVRRICLFHPNSIHLMDMVCCPNCKASQIKEFADFDKKRDSWKKCIYTYIYILIDIVHVIALFYVRY